jgi:UDP-glucuronate 4-epimerase
MKILITGVAGFVGFYLAKRLLEEGHIVLGIDNVSNYYDVNLKRARLAQLVIHPNFQFYYLDISHRAMMADLFQTQVFDRVVHLAGQVGVRDSLHPSYTSYMDSNLVGFVNVLEGCRQTQVKHLIYASSSFVYGANQKVPFAMTDDVHHPIAFDAATKRSNELMAHTYSHLYDLPTTGLRFFTVYGPWGRPDMAYFKFVQAIAQGQPIYVYNNGEMKRDFIYIDDVVESMLRLLNRPLQAALPYKLYNIGNHQPVELLRFIEGIEQAIGKSARKKFFPMQLGDVPITYADIDNLMQDIDFRPTVPIEVGIPEFVRWYYDYYKVSSTHNQKVCTLARLVK